MVEPDRPDNLIVDPSDFLDSRQPLATCAPSQSCLDVVRCRQSHVARQDGAHREEGLADPRAVRSVLRRDRAERLRPSSAGQGGDLGSTRAGELELCIGPHDYRSGGSTALRMSAWGTCEPARYPSTWAHRLVGVEIDGVGMDRPSTRFQPQTRRPGRKQGRRAHSRVPRALCTVGIGADRAVGAL